MVHAINASKNYVALPSSAYALPLYWVMVGTTHIHTFLLLSILSVGGFLMGDIVSGMHTDVISTYLHNSDSKVYLKCFYGQSKSKGTKGSIHSSLCITEFICIQT